MIYTLDHPPAHVHAVRGTDSVVFILGCPKGAVSIREAKGITRSEQQALLYFVEDNVEMLCKAWEELHDKRGRVPVS